jgi:Tfp pilus assembly protein PilN
MKINLLPKEYRPQPAVSFPRLLFVIIFIVAIFGTGCFLALESLSLNEMDANISKVDQDLNLYGQQYLSVKVIEDQETAITKAKQDIDAVSKPYVPVNQYLGEIVAPLPDKVWLKSLTIDDKGFSIDGNTDRLRAVAMYMMDLEASPIFSGTNLTTINNSTSKGLGDVFDFKLTFQAEKAGLKQ